MFETELTGDISIEEFLIGFVKSNRYAVLGYSLWGFIQDFRLGGWGGGTMLCISEVRDSGIPPPDFWPHYV